MQILNRVIAAGALVVPMALGAAGVAMADVAANSSPLPTQIEAPNDHNSDSCRHEDDGFLGFLGSGNGQRIDSPDSECQRHDNGGEDNKGPLG